MPAGMIATTACNIGAKTETNSGTAENAPGQYPFLAGDVALQPDKPPVMQQFAGQVFPQAIYRGTESHKTTLPFPPVLSGNGLGNMIVRLMGLDTPTQIGATTAYKHVIEWEDLAKTMTLWMAYSATDIEKMRMVAIDSYDVQASKDGSVKFDFPVVGTGLEKATDYGTENQLDPELAHYLNFGGIRAEIGQPQAAIRENINDLKINFKRNIQQGAPGKAGQHPEGSNAYNTCYSKNSDAKLTLEYFDRDGEEEKRWFKPTNTAPAATTIRPTDVVSRIKSRITFFGDAIAGHVWGEADYVNAGTTAFTFAGTYSGGNTVTIGEGQMGEYVYETTLSDEKDLSFHLKDAAATYEVVTGAALAVAVVGKAITVTLGAAGSTAAAVLAALQASTAACALMDFSLAEGSDGTGVITLAQAEIDATDCLNGFRFRYTTGGPWSAWSGWMMATKAVAQDLVSGLTVTLDDDDITAEGDKFYFYSHALEYLRFYLPRMVYSKWTPKSGEGAKMATSEFDHSSTQEANRPYIEMVTTDTTAYS